MPPRLYVYKCIYDEGGAPCIDGNRLSLAICKPAIRSVARAGDLVFAFGSNHETPANRLVYIAKVDRNLRNGEYYELAEFAGRGDCIYERGRDGRFRRRLDARFHPDPAAIFHDLGHPPRYPRANTLVSDDFHYFGASGTDSWKLMAPKLRRKVESLQRGHRVNHSDEIRQELLALKNWAWTNYRQKVNGKPLHAVPQSEDDPNGGCKTKCRPERQGNPRKSCSS